MPVYEVHRRDVRRVINYPWCGAKPVDKKDLNTTDSWDDVTCKRCLGLRRRVLNKHVKEGIENAK